MKESRSRRILPPAWKNGPWLYRTSCAWSFCTVVERAGRTTESAPIQEAPAHPKSGFFNGLLTTGGRGAMVVRLESPMFCADTDYRHVLVAERPPVIH